MLLKTGPVNSYSLKWSIALHGVLLLAAIVLPLLPAFRPKEVVIPVDFTVVLEENLIEPNVPPEVAPQPEKTTEPEKTETVPDPDPPKPVPLPNPPKDAVVVEKKKEPEKKPVKKPEPVKKPPEPVKKPEPFKKGKRIELPKKPQQPKFEELYKPYDPSKPPSVKPVTEKMLSRAEIAKALREGARAGTRNVIPEDEISRCVLLVKRALYDAWEQPGTGDAGTRPALMDIRLDSTGRIVSYRIRQSSGSAYFDQTVLKAAANSVPVRGLTLAFLKQYETLTVEFKLE
ncbi:MAG: TonB C-terminal domain-containing protein [Kiritimatiellae bacterium]|nr:TonB C-terminal domain-containing protein [Kiritimatiellia bacterium]